MATGVAAKSGCAGGKCGLPGKTCFVAGTKIKAEHGPKAIEDVKVGDKVWAKNQITGKDELREVDRTYVWQVEKLLHLTIAGR